MTLQIGRGLAAIAVAAFHLSIATGDPKFDGDGTRTLWSWFSHGSLGVDFFFVLSGFIILQAHLADVNNPSGLTRYGLRRASRIFPIYWLYLSAAIVGMALVGSKYLELQSLGDWVTVYSLARITDVGLPLAQAWTLFHEVAFYVLFALLIVNKQLGLVVFAIWFLAISYYFYYPPNAGQSFRDTVLGAYNLNFFIGMAAMLLLRHLNGRAAVALLLAGTLLLVTNYRVQMAGIDQMLYAIGFGALVSSVAALERLGKISPAATLGFIGDASYSIYLLHEHVENYSLRALIKLGFLERWNNLVVFWVVMSITVAVGCLAYQYLERPMLRWLRQRLEIPAGRRDHAVATHGRDRR